MYWLLGESPEIPGLNSKVGQPEIIDGMAIGLAFDGRFSTRQEFQASLAVELDKCDQIPVFDGESLDAFNPDGSGTSAWNRSVCFQQLAAEYLSPEICNNVWQRYSVLRTSWRFSEPSCRCKVQHRQQAVSRKVYDQVNRHRSGGMKLLGMTARKSGRGERYQFDLQFSGENSGHYRVQIYVLDEQGGPRLVLAKDLRVSNKIDEYKLGISAQNIKEVIPAGELGKLHSAVVVTTLIIDQFGAIDPGWINSIWPASRRSQIYKTDLQF